MSITPVTSLPPIGQGVTATPQKPGAAKPGQNVFSDIVKGANQQQMAADQAVEQLVAGNADSLHNVVLSAAKADLSFRLVLEIRNKLMESYQEIMRMQV